MNKLLGILGTLVLGACMAFAQQPAGQNPNPQPQDQTQRQRMQQQGNQQAQPGQQGRAGQQTLPRTASPLPLIAILGFGAIGAGVAARSRREAME